MPPLQPILDYFGGVSRYDAVQQAPDQSATRTINVRGVHFTPSDMNKLRNVLFAEVSNRDPKKQQLEARTIANTVINRAASGDANSYGSGVDGVLSKPKQYQGYGAPEYKRIASGGTRQTDAQKLAAIDAVLAELHSGNFSDNIEGYTFYHHNPDGSIIATPASGKASRYASR